MLPRWILLVALCCLLPGCNSVSTRKAGETLVTTLDDYVAALRWGRFDQAAQYHRKRDKSRSEIDTSQVDYIRVTGHTMKKKTVNDAVDEAQVEVELQYYHNEYGTLKKTVIQQDWWYDQELKGWFLASDFPKF